MSGATDDTTALATALHARGVACTAQRQAVWRYFQAHPQGHAIGEVVAALRSDGIGQATVYRTIFLFLDLGLLDRVQDPDGKVCFLAAPPGHTHPLICRGCRAVVAFDACDLSVLEKLLATQTGYTVESHRLEVIGLCPRCQAACSTKGHTA